MGLATSERVSRWTHDRVLLAGVLMVSAVAWAALLTVGTHHHSTAGHEMSGHHMGSSAGSLSVPVHLTGWALMVLAMMLPPALPLLQVVSRLAGVRRARFRVVAAAAVSYLAIWIVVGALLLGASLLAQRVLPSDDEAHRFIAATGVLLIGAYQFSPAKAACLTACRSPRFVALGSWTGARPPTYEAAAIGLRYAAICVGCCWALMALMFVGGTSALPVMVVVAGVMVAERLVTSVRFLVPAVAVACFAMAAAIALGWINTTW